MWINLKFFKQQSLVGLWGCTTTLELRYGPNFFKAAVENFGQWAKAWSS